MDHQNVQEIIDEKVIGDCEMQGACNAGLDWLRKKPRTYKQLSTKSKDWLRWLAQHSTLPYVLEKLSADSDSYVRRFVAQNAATPVPVLEKLSADSDTDVRRGVAQNAATPVLEKLSADSDTDVRLYVALNAARKRTRRVNGN